MNSAAFITTSHNRQHLAYDELFTLVALPQSKRGAVAPCSMGGLQVQELGDLTW